MSKKPHIQLSETEHQHLKKLRSQGNLSARSYRRVIGLLELHQGNSYTTVSQTTGVTKQTVSNWAQNYRATGLDFLTDKPRSGRPRKIKSFDEAIIIALACSDPPEGYSQWSLRLLSDHSIGLLETDTISHSQIGRVLKKTNLNLI